MLKILKKTWDILKELTSGKSEQVQIDKIKVDCKIITDQSAMEQPTLVKKSLNSSAIANSVEPTVIKPTD